MSSGRRPHKLTEEKSVMFTKFMEVPSGSESPWRTIVEGWENVQGNSHSLFALLFYSVLCIFGCCEREDTELALSGPAAVFSHIYLQSHLHHRACI